MKYGNLIYNPDTERWDIDFVDGSCYGGLHCGDCFEVFYQGEWLPTRIEMGENWYLVGLPAQGRNIYFLGIEVRV